MALVVEDGTAKSDAESYASVAFADTYVADYLNGDATWDAADTSTKEVALRVGTAFINNKYRLRWKGYARTREQALAYPRNGVVDFDGYIIPTNEVPLTLQHAAVEAAVRFLDSDTTLEPDATFDQIGVKSLAEKFDVFSQSIEYAGARSTQPSFTKIDRLISDLLKSGGGMTADRG